MGVKWHLSTVMICILQVTNVLSFFFPLMLIDYLFLLVGVSSLYPLTIFGFFPMFIRKPSLYILGINTLLVTQE